MRSKPRSESWRQRTPRPQLRGRRYWRSEVGVLAPRCPSHSRFTLSGPWPLRPAIRGRHHPPPAQASVSDDNGRLHLFWNRLPSSVGRAGPALPSWRPHWMLLCQTKRAETYFRREDARPHTSFPGFVPSGQRLPFSCACTPVLPMCPLSAPSSSHHTHPLVVFRPLRPLKLGDDPMLKFLMS